ncbi:MAG: hypothetical protein IBX70_02450 [Clostridia bacterium]|nr:hypothetical protein [Clostridia bacterium]MDW7660750.1 hypothetical protein [Bacillota bacterium]
MDVKVLSLQMEGVNIANLKEEEILARIKEDVINKGKSVEDAKSVEIYINIEGTAVTAYYACEKCSGAVLLNP